MRRGLGGIVVLATCVVMGLALGTTLAPADGPPCGGAHPGVCAGVGVVDASWHVGASAGQYASDGSFVDPEKGTYDPSGLSTRRRSSYGIQSRLSVRALVVDGPQAGTGDRFALVKNDMYIPQDLVYRRAGQIVAEDRPDLGIDATNLTMAVTHNHNSPFYSSTSWGVWTFQDVFDIRFYNYMAHRMASAVEAAADALKPVRIGAAVVDFDKTHRHSYGPAIADDGTPAGYPKSDSVHDVSVVRFDDVSDPIDPKPLINLLNWGQHPESLNGNDLISGDYIAPLQRMLDRETGATTVFTQGAVGTAEPERDEWHSIHDRAQFSHREYAQAEYGARLIANAVEQAWSRAGSCGSGSGRCIPFKTDIPVQFTDHWYPGPLTHPYPTVSNCRTDSGLAGNPLLPIVGLPDCASLASGLDSLSDLIGGPAVPAPDPAVDPGLSTDDFEALGIPVPENYGAPSYTGLEEDIDVHLQAFRLGDILFTVCPCEEFKDQWQNIVTRTDGMAGDEYLGFDWSAQCTQQPDGGWLCPNPGDPSQKLPEISDLKFQRMRAQVNNPANGWNDLANVLWAESEPADPAQIKGNFTHDDTQDTPERGYALTIPMAMGNDYNGYIPSYREYQRGDHYRKALAGWGPHSSDYLATRLVTLGRKFKDSSYQLPADQVTESAYAPKVAADLALNDARAAALGRAGDTAVAAYESALPNDGGAAGPVSQPADVERFGATFFTWNGGSNFTDDPVVKVQREVAGQWQDYADQSGEIPVTLQFPDAPAGVAPYLLGDQQWHWTAHFEAFVAGYKDRTFNTGDRDPVTPAGNYRFLVDGKRRQGGRVVSYQVASHSFQVKPWDGILVQDLRLEPDATISFTLGPRTTRHVEGPGINGVNGATFDATIGPIDYPDTYASPARFIRKEHSFERDPAAPSDPGSLEWYCFTCTFRPWVDYGDARSANVAIALNNGRVEVVPATEQADGRWVTARTLRPGESAQVRAGDVLDPYGNTNQPSGVVTRSPGPPSRTAAPATQVEQPAASTKSKRCKRKHRLRNRRCG